MNARAVSANNPERRKVLTRAVLRAGELLGLSRQELADSIGLSPSSISRMYSEGYFLEEGSKNWELAALLVRLYRGLDAVAAGDEQTLQAWMRNQNTDLHAVPASLVTHVAGLANVVSYVDACRARI